MTLPRPSPDAPFDWQRGALFVVVVPTTHTSRPYTNNGTHLDRLHSESVRFTDFHVAPMCTPSRAELMTGVDALRTGAMNVSSGRTLLRRDLPTMANLFAAAGYRTGIFGKWHLGDMYPYRPNDRGFQDTLCFRSSYIGSAADRWNNDYFNDHYLFDDRYRPVKGYCTDVFFERAIEWIKDRAKNKETFFKNCWI